jgi:hypothetical protein
MRIHFMVLAVLVGACGQGVKGEDVELKQATKDTQQALEGASAARKVLEIFGVLPSYSCGPLNGAIGMALPPVSVPFSCGTLGTRANGLDLAFAESGCEVGGHLVKGTLAFELGVGEDRVDVSVDFRKLSIDGEVLPVRVGAGVCGDEKRVWATVDGVAVADSVFRLDAQLGYRKGLPLIGHTDLTLDGTGSLEQPKPVGTTSVAAEGLEYELGAMLPKAGRLTVNRTDGTHFSVKFTEVLWKVGKAELTVGDREPVEVPIVN